MTQDFIYNMDVLIPIVQLTSNERYFSAGWLNESVLIQSQKLCCKSFLLPDIRATSSFFSRTLFQSLKRRVSKRINLENESVANVSLSQSKLALSNLHALQEATGVGIWSCQSSCLLWKKLKNEITKGIF